MSMLLIDTPLPGVRRLTLNRPEKKNCVNSEVMCRLYDAWVELDRDLDPRHPSPPPGIEDPLEYAKWLRGRSVDYLVSPLADEGPIRLRFERGMVFATSRHALSQVPRSD